MPGPVPKPDGQRARRNVSELAWTDLPAVGRSGPVPKPPAGSGWSARGKAWWKDAWGTPSATQWGDRGDYWSAVRRAELEDAWGSTKDPKYLPEMRHLEAALGLTAKARKELRWRIVAEGVVVEQNGEAKRDELADRRRRAG